MRDTTELAHHLPNVLRDAAIPDLPGFFRGKVRDNYDLSDGRRVLIATDRISAFDRILAAVPLKGAVLTRISRFWFDTVADICAHHALAYPDPNVVVCRRVSILPVEIVVRDYLTGTTATSLWPMYRGGRREMYGLQFPDGLQEHQKLPATVITPTTKAAEGGHDVELAAVEIVERGLLTDQQWRTVRDLAFALFARGRSIAAERGLILVDTKYEFGVDGNGQVILADEIHTPDSSRYWLKESYEARVHAGRPPESLDKDFVRTWVRSRCDPYVDEIPEIPQDVILAAAARYVEACEKITGEAFVAPDPHEPALERIRRNLSAYLAGGGAGFEQRPAASEGRRRGEQNF